MQCCTFFSEPKGVEDIFFIFIVTRRLKVLDMRRFSSIEVRTIGSRRQRWVNGTGADAMGRQFILIAIPSEHEAGFDHSANLSCICTSRAKYIP